jgi:ABC-type branched-subunit amino acid transport system substrate-binding protein
MTRSRVSLSKLGPRLAAPRLLAIGFLLLAAGCAQRAEPLYQEPEPQPVEPAEVIEPLPAGPVKVALLLPLTGNAADVGQDMLEAAQIALFDVGQTDMVLLPRDTGGTIEGAAAAARSAIDAGAELILGPLFATSTGTVAGIAREHELKVISFSNDATVSGDNVWVVGFRPEEQVARVIEFAQRQGLTRIGALAPDDAYGQRVVNGFREAIGAAGSGLGGPSHAFYPPDEREAARVVREFTGYVEPPEGALGVSGNSRQFDALLLADGGSRLRSIAALLAFYDIDPATTRLLGTMLWESDPRLLFEETLQGGWYASVSPEGERNFQARFEQAFGRQPGALAGLAYDATALAAVVAASDRRFPADLLTDPSGFVGRAGIFRLRDDGTTEHGLAVLEIDNGSARVVEPAPTSFLVALLGQ